MDKEKPKVISFKQRDEIGSFPEKVMFLQKTCKENLKLQCHHLNKKRNSETEKCC